MKKPWQKASCPICGFTITFRPKPKWDGLLRCPICQRKFRVGRLDEFS